jgi:hypothetical protein
MALKPCRECGAPVSTSAKRCPHCGVPLPIAGTVSTGVGCLVVGVVVYLIFSLSGGSGKPASRTTPAQPPAPAAPHQLSETDQAWEVLAAAEKAVRSMLRDPKSGQFGVIEVYWLHTNGNSVMVACGSVNAKNGFGGYSGSRRFISGGNVESTMMQEANSAKAFAGTWAGACKGKPIITQRAR